MRLDLDEHLTADKNTSKALITHKGMAHFAGTGPTDKSCRECWNWKISGLSHAYYSKHGKHGPTLKDHPCQKFRALTGSKGPDVPHESIACKYFESSDTPPSINDPRVKRGLE